MTYLLSILYLLLLLLFSPWLAIQAWRKGKYREGYAAKLLGRVPLRTAEGPCVWLHAVSVGEVNLLAPLLKEIHQAEPAWRCVVSTTTMTGMALARKKYPELTVFYCPLDFSWAVRHAMRRMRPDVLVLVELELWPNLVRAAKEAGARVMLINGRLSERSFQGYRRIRPLVASVLRQIDTVAAQDETYAARFRALGAPAERVQVTGSMKFDGAQTERNNPATCRLAGLVEITSDDIIFLAGSTQEPEEAVAVDVFRHLAETWPRLRLILVPRHPERFAAVARMLDASGLPWQRRTAFAEGDRSMFSANVADHGEGQAAEKRNSPRPRILLVDVIGELGAWWGTAHIAFVGGSLGNRGGQNMIEPAAYGAAVSFGPNTRNFRDIVAMMLAHDAAVVVPDGPALETFVRHVLEEPHYGEAIGARARQLVLEQVGATRRTRELLGHLVAGGQ
jgi:3-deoxy-D-manno-octulosonic-acid transferase